MYVYTATLNRVEQRTSKEKQSYPYYSKAYRLTLLSLQYFPACTLFFVAAVYVYNIIFASF